MSKSIKEKIDHIFDVNIELIFNESENVTMKNIFDPIHDAADALSDSEVDEYEFSAGEDPNEDDIPLYGDMDEDIHFILDAEELLQRIFKARKRQEKEMDTIEDMDIPDNYYDDLVTGLESDQLEEDRVPAKTIAQLIKKKKEAFKKKREIIKKVGVATYRKKQKVAKKKRRLNRVKLKRQRKLYLKSAKGKRAQKFSKQRQDMLKGKKLDDIAKVPKIAGIMGRGGVAGK